MHSFRSFCTLCKNNCSRLAFIFLPISAYGYRGGIIQAGSDDSALGIRRMDDLSSAYVNGYMVNTAGTIEYQVARLDIIQTHIGSTSGLIGCNPGNADSKIC